MDQDGNKNLAMSGLDNDHCITTSSSNISRVAIQQLLVDQYTCTEEYCNSSTALHNTVMEQQYGEAAIDNDNEQEVLRSSIDRYQRSLQDIQSIFCILEETGSILREMKCNINSYKEVKGVAIESQLLFVRLFNLQIFAEHLQRTRRILNTIYSAGEGTSFYANGIPTPKSNKDENMNVKLIALSTLRASIQTVQESLPP